MDNVVQTEQQVIPVNQNIPVNPDLDKMMIYLLYILLRGVLLVLMTLLMLILTPQLTTTLPTPF